MSDRTERTSRLWCPSSMLAGALGIAIVLLFLPETWTYPGKDSVAIVLRPGQTFADSGRRWCDRLWAGVKRHRQSVEQLADAQRELAQLQDENRRLHASLAAARSKEDRAPENTADKDRLLLTECVAANVLGQQARAFLGQHYILDRGSQTGIQPNSLLVDAGPALIDRGVDARLEADHLVLSGTRIWGKVVDVGRYTSMVRSVTEPGFRDLVRLADPHTAARDRRRGPQGILEGIGDALARIRLIETTEPVAVGDAVYTTAGQGVLPEPLLYGYVVRAEHPAGAAHWEIWMKPAVQRTEPVRVAVLRTKLNPLRVADRTEHTE